MRIKMPALLEITKKVAERRINADILADWPPTCPFVLHQPKRPKCMKTVNKCYRQ